MGLKVLKARSDAVSAAFLLFPTIAHIALTPNGQSLSVGSLTRFCPCASSLSFCFVVAISISIPSDYLMDVYHMSLFTITYLGSAIP